MQLQQLYSWYLSSSQSQDVQRKLATSVSEKNEGISPKFIADVDIVDISATNDQGIATGAIVLLVYPKLILVDVTVSEQMISSPYISLP